MLLVFYSFLSFSCLTVCFCSAPSSCWWSAISLCPTVKVTTIIKAHTHTFDILKQLRQIAIWFCALQFCYATVYHYHNNQKQTAQKELHQHLACWVQREYIENGKEPIIIDFAPPITFGAHLIETMLLQRWYDYWLIWLLKNSIGKLTHLLNYHKFCHDILTTTWIDCMEIPLPVQHSIGRVDPAPFTT